LLVRLKSEAESSPERASVPRAASTKEARFQKDRFYTLAAASRSISA